VDEVQVTQAATAAATRAATEAATKAAQAMVVRAAEEAAQRVAKAQSSMIAAELQKALDPSQEGGLTQEALEEIVRGALAKTVPVAAPVAPEAATRSEPVSSPSREGETAVEDLMTLEEPVFIPEDLTTKDSPSKLATTTTESSSSGGIDAAAAALKMLSGGRKKSRRKKS